MTLKWASNENPVASSKLNKMSVTFWANEAAIDTTQVQVGSLVYLEDTNKLRIVKQISPSLILGAIGGGLITNLYFGNLRANSIPPATYRDSILGSSDTSGQATNDISRVLTDGGSVATFADNRTYTPVHDLSFAGKPIGKIAITMPLGAGLVYSAAQAPTFKFNATNTKVEILDDATVKATLALPADISGTLASGTNHAIGGHLYGVVDLNEFVLTKFKVKVYIETNTSITTNLTAHKHGWISQSNTDTGDTLIFNRLGRLEIQVL